MIRLLVSCKTATILWLSVMNVSAVQPFRIEIVDRENQWPVPLVELVTTHRLSFFSDNAGLIAMDSPELMNKEVWFTLRSDGYGVKADGFGIEGIKATPVPGGKMRVEVDRRMLAKRLGRLTGAGLFAESEKLGFPAARPETGVMGSDSVLLAKHGDQLFWLWGDTHLARYPLGIFDSPAARTPVPNSGISWQPPLSLNYDYFKGADGRPRGVATISGDGPTWLTGMVSLKDQRNQPRLVATYMKIKPPLDPYETGLCVWDETKESFGRHQRIWGKSDGKEKPLPKGHPVRWTDPQGKAWLLFGDPFPDLKCADNFEAWSDPSQWEKVPAPTSPKSADGSSIEPHRGSICWNAHRKKWITVYTQNFGKPSAFGELWYAEADSPFGPWGTAVKVLSHHNYTFYNPRIQYELTPADASFILFEGSYTAEFANHPPKTPRYDYNQILYRLDLDDPGLMPVRK